MTDEAAAEIDEDVDGEEGEDGEGGEGAAEATFLLGMSKKKFFIIAGAAGLVLLLAIGGGLFFFVFSGSGSGGGDDDTMLVAEVTPTFFYDMQTMTVNLNTSGDEEEKFLKLSVSLELANEEMLTIIEPRMARVRDAFQVYLRELRRSDLEGSAGIYRLKEELRRRVNLAIFPAQVDSILFKEILVQ